MVVIQPERNVSVAVVFSYLPSPLVLSSSSKGSSWLGWIDVLARRRSLSPPSPVYHFSY
jgi:hypothetical protein